MTMRLITSIRKPAARAIATLQAFRAFRPIAGSSSPVQMLERFEFYCSRFTLLSDRTLLFLADFDGEFGPLMLNLARRAGPVFDVILN